MNPPLLDRAHRRHAGRRREREMRELVDLLNGLTKLAGPEGSELIKAITGASDNFAKTLAAIKGLDPIAGGAELTETATANVALTTTQATVIGPLLSVGQAPLELVLFYASNVTGIATLASVVANLVRSDTSAVFGSGTITNGAASAQAAGPLEVIGIVPPGIPAGNGVLAQAAASSGTATVVGSATAPIILAILGIS